MVMNLFHSFVEIGTRELRVELPVTYERVTRNGQFKVVHVRYEQRMSVKNGKSTKKERAKDE